MNMNSYTHHPERREQNIVARIYDIPGVINSSVDYSCRNCIHLFELRQGLVNIEAYKKTYETILSEVHKCRVIHGSVLPTSLYISSDGKYAGIANWRNAFLSDDTSAQEEDYRQLDESLREIHSSRPRSTDFSSGGIIPLPTSSFENEEESTMQLMAENIDVESPFPIPTIPIESHPEKNFLAQKVNNVSGRKLDSWYDYTEGFAIDYLKPPFQWSETIPCLSSWPQVREYFFDMAEVIFLFTVWKDARTGLGKTKDPRARDNDHSHMPIENDRYISHNEFKSLENTVYHCLVQKLRKEMVNMIASIQMNLYLLAFFLARERFPDETKKVSMPCYGAVTRKHIISDNPHLRGTTEEDVQTIGKEIYSGLLSMSARVIKSIDFRGEPCLPDGMRPESHNWTCDEVMNILKVQHIDDSKLSHIASSIHDKTLPKIEKTFGNRTAQKYQIGIVKSVGEFFPNIVRNMDKVIEYQGGGSLYFPSHRMDRVEKFARDPHFTFPRGRNILEVYTDLNGTLNDTLSKFFNIPNDFYDPISFNIPMNPIRIRYKKADEWHVDTNFVFDYASFGSYIRHFRQRQDPMNRGEDIAIYYFDAVLYAQLVALMDNVADKAESGIKKPPLFLRQQEMVPELVKAQKDLLASGNLGSRS